MKTKVISVSFDEVKVVDMLVNLGDSLEKYMSAFLSLKNHERNTEEILEVRGINDSNTVHVVILFDDESDVAKSEAEYVDHCKDFASQFGKVESCDIETAWILDKDSSGIDYALDYKDWYIYG